MRKLPSFLAGKYAGNKVVFSITIVFLISLLMYFSWFCTTLTAEKKNLKLCSETIGEPKISIRRLACVIGNIVATFPSVPHGKLFYRVLEKLKIS